MAKWNNKKNNNNNNGIDNSSESDGEMTPQYLIENALVLLLCISKYSTKDHLKLKDR